MRAFLLDTSFRRLRNCFRGGRARRSKRQARSRGWAAAWWASCHASVWIVLSRVTGALRPTLEALITSTMVHLRAALCDACAVLQGCTSMRTVVARVASRRHCWCRGRPLGPWLLIRLLRWNRRGLHAANACRRCCRGVGWRGGQRAAWRKRGRAGRRRRVGRAACGGLRGNALPRVQDA